MVALLRSVRGGALVPLAGIVGLLAAVACEPVYLGTLDPENIDNTECNARIRYIDFDGDGYGSEPIELCEWEETLDERYIEQSGDCNDAYAFIHPGADEVCNDTDDDCDDEVDEGFEALRGNILVDTTLPADTRWCVPDNLTIAAGVTLTLEAGAVLAGQIAGVTEGGPVPDEPGLAFRSVSVDNLGMIVARGAEGAHVHLYDLAVRSVWEGAGAKPTVLLQHAWVHGGTFSGDLRGGLVVEDSVVDTTMPISVVSGSLFERNVFLDRAGVGDLIVTDSSKGGPPTIRHNVFVGPPPGVAVVDLVFDVGSSLFEGGQWAFVELRGNSFLGDGLAVGYFQEQESGLDATNNYWGTGDRAEIQAKIRDSNDALTLGTIAYEPWLVVPDPAAPDPTAFLPEN